MATFIVIGWLLLVGYVLGYHAGYRDGKGKTV
jgi:hypothetical protein